MAKNQMKRLAAPKTWPIARKGRQRWIAKPLPGAHKQGLCMPLSVIFRDILKLASTAREVKQILHNNEVLINGRRVKDVKFGVGLFDVLAVKEINEYYRVVLTKKNKLALVSIKSAEAKILPLRVKSKTTIRGGKNQINFTNGWNLLDKASHAIGTTVLFDIAKQKPSKDLKLKKGEVVTLVAGKYVGRLAKVEEIKSEGKLRKRKLAHLTSIGKSSDADAAFSTTADNLFVVGDAKAEFTSVEE